MEKILEEIIIVFFKSIKRYKFLELEIIINLSKILRNIYLEVL